MSELKYIITLTFCFLVLSLNAATINLSGFVVSSSTNKAIPFATVGFPVLNKWTTTDGHGKFYFSNISHKEAVLEVRCVGFQQFIQPVDLSKKKLITIKLKELNLKLETVTVTAKENTESGTSSKINQQTMEHIQPSSAADLLQLLPGNPLPSNDLSKVQTVQMRQAGSDANTALGTAFVIDGIPVSNNANMQSIAGLNTDSKSRYRNNQNNGIDLRKISTDDLESVEVIRGIPSVEHGDVLSGVINVKRKFGVTQNKVRIKTNLNQKLFSWGKGFELSPRAGVLNIGANYLNHKVDPSSSLANYQRLGSSLKYGNVFQLGEKKLNFKMTTDYTFTVDNDKEDPELNHGQIDRYRSTDNWLRFSTNGQLIIEGDYIESVKFTARGSHRTTFTERERFVQPQGPTPSLQNSELGVHDGTFLPDNYIAYASTKGNPISYFAKLSMKGKLPFLKQNNSTLIGVEWKYDKNNGAGQQFDPSRPISASACWSVFPRSFSSIPSLQNISGYIEQNISIPVDEHMVKIMAGFRASAPLNISEKYAMNGQVYLDPRTNLTWQLPRFYMFGKKMQLTFHTGYGVLTKFPTMAHLYPDTKYGNIIQLNYYSQNADLRRLNVLTYATDPTNYDITPSTNRKFELGFKLRKDDFLLSVTAFNEYSSSGFANQTEYTPIEYTKYIPSSVNPDGLTTPPALSLFDYTNETRFVSSSQTSNSVSLKKQGIEYTLKLPKWRSIHTRATISGAYFHTRYDNSNSVIYHPNSIINGKPYPYLGVYSNSRSSKVKERLNTRMQFDTHIPKLRMIASTTINSTWFYSQGNLPTHENPTHYIGLDGVRHVFTDQDANDPLLSLLTLDLADDYLKPNVTPISVSLNFRLSKEIRDHLKLSFYVNNLLDYNPSYTSKYGTTIYRTVTPSFGMELSIKI